MTTACTATPDLFFDTRRVGDARALCATCPLTEHCRTLAADEDYGVWGGRDTALTDREQKILESYYDQRVSRSGIAHKLGVTVSVVADVIRRNPGWRTASFRLQRADSTDTLAEHARLSTLGHTDKAIAARLGIKVKSLQTALRRAAA